MLVSKNAKICVTPNAKTPNRWNKGRVGSPTQNYRVGHVDFMLIVLILQWNMGFKEISLTKLTARYSLSSEVYQAYNGALTMLKKVI